MSISTGHRLLSGALVVAALATLQCSPRGPRAPSERPAGLWRVQGAEIVDDAGRPVVLRGIAFGNQVWENVAIPRTHHDERDYARLAALGMNSVRFYLNYRTFESDAAPGEYLEEGWRWLDDNIAWARKHGIRLVLNFHVPPGGYQSGGKGGALWNNEQNQQRLANLWQAIALRYRDEPTIAGYDLVNEPVVTSGIGQWKTLAEKLIAAIREVDAHHMIFVERVNAIDGDWSENEERNFFRVADPNVVYEFHFYKPFHFTHQSAQWVTFAAEDQRYPDANVASVEWFLLDSKHQTTDAPMIPPGDSDWTYREGAAFEVTDPAIVVAKPALRCSNNPTGTARFDELTLEQKAPGGEWTKMWQTPLSTTRGWYFWEKTPGGAFWVGDEAKDGKAVAIRGTKGQAAASADPLAVKVQQGYAYRLNAWTRGEKIPAGAECQAILDFFSSRVPVQVRDRGFLAQELGAYVGWAKREGVPLYLGEFGATKPAFENDRGGARWVADMLDILIEEKVSFAYHDYHEDMMGLFQQPASVLPDEAHLNRPLWNVFEEKLSGRSPSPPPSAETPAAPAPAASAAVPTP